MSFQVGIWGVGESGVGAALLSQKYGYDLVLVAESPPSSPYAAQLQAAGLPYTVTSEPYPLLASCEVIIRSPGIRPDHPTLRRLKREGFLVISDLEWGWRHFPSDAQLWLVTGTTGKSSTTTLLAHVLRTGGRDAIACGNLGYSFCAALAEPFSHEYYVLEASSFQLWDTLTLVPHLAVITNLSLNHIDWHGSFEAYAEAKLHFVARLPETSHLLYDAGSSYLVEALSRFPTCAQVWRYREEKGAGIHAWIENHKLICDMTHLEDNERWEVSYQGTSLESPGQRKNGLAAAIASRLAHLRRKDLQEAFQTLQAMPHRLEQVALIEGVLYVNDSKASTTTAVWNALCTFERPIIWIAGGVDKGNDWGELLDIVQARVKALVMIGKDTQKMEEAFSKVVPTVVRATSMEDAVEKARALAQEGDVVLLSPACASFDWFRSFEHRGDAFREAVLRLKEQRES